MEVEELEIGDFDPATYKHVLLGGKLLMTSMKQIRWKTQNWATQMSRWKKR